jgi:hypothetical protein
MRVGGSRRVALGLAVAVAATLALSACSGDAAGAHAAPDTTSTSATTTSSPTATASVSPGVPATTVPGQTATIGISPQPPEVTPTDLGDGGPGGSAPPTSQETILETLPGDPSGACVNGDGQRDVRSGGIGAGTFSEAVTDFADQSDGDGTVSLHWIPAHGEDLTLLTITASQLSGGSATFVTEQTNVSDLVDESGQWRYYFITELTIPATGVWQFQATSGADTGCFTVTFADA